MKKEIEHVGVLHRLVWLVTWLVFICLIAVTVALAMAIANDKDAGVIAAYASAGGPLLAAISVALIADRQLKNDNLRKKMTGI